MSSVVRSVGRNAWCTCGSGRRYKECHGAIGLRPLPNMHDVMLEALQLQQTGHTRKAAELYELVLTSEPNNFDAIHMLGVVQYQRGMFPEAWALLKRATELRPDLTVAHHNLALVESVSMNERELCRDALARAAALVEPARDVRGLMRDAALTHLVVADGLSETDTDTVNRIVAGASRERLQIWSPSGGRVGGLCLHAIEISAQSHPVGGLMVFLGTSHPSLVWIDSSQSKHVILIVTQDDPSALLDGIRQLSQEGRTSIGIAYATCALADRVRFPKNSQYIGLDES